MPKWIDLKHIGITIVSVVIGMLVYEKLVAPRFDTVVRTPEA